MSSADTFYVAALDGQKNVAGFVPAHFLLDSSGNRIVDPFSGGSQKKLYADSLGSALYTDPQGGAAAVPGVNSGNWLIAPDAFTIATSQSFASQIKSVIGNSDGSTGYPEAGLLQALGIMSSAFGGGGAQDLQRGTQWGVPSGLVVPAFVDTASYHLGVVTGLSGLPLYLSEAGGGVRNAFKGLFDNSIVVDPNYGGLSTANGMNLNKGFEDAFKSQFQSGSVSGDSFLDSTLNLHTLTFDEPDAANSAGVSGEIIYSDTNGATSSFAMRIV